MVDLRLSQMCSLCFLGLPAIKRYIGLDRSIPMGVVCGTQSRYCLGLHSHDVHICHVVWLISNVSNTQPLYRDRVPLRKVRKLQVDLIKENSNSGTGTFIKIGMLQGKATSTRMHLYGRWIGFTKSMPYRYTKNQISCAIIIMLWEILGFSWL